MSTLYPESSTTSKVTSTTKYPTTAVITTTSSSYSSCVNGASNSESDCAYCFSGYCGDYCTVANPCLHGESIDTNCYCDTCYAGWSGVYCTIPSGALIREISILKVLFLIILIILNTSEQTVCISS